MRNTSLSLRLTAWFSAIFLAGFVLFGLALRFDLAYSLSSGRDRTLSRRATRLMDFLDSARPDPPQRIATKFNEFADATPEGNLIQVYDATDRLLYPAAARPRDFPWPATGRLARERYTSVFYAHREYRVLARPVLWNSRRLCLLVAGNLEDNRQLLARFSMGLGASIPLLLALSALAGYWMSRRALAPVDRLTTAVRSISIGNLSGRLPTYQTGDELQRLAETCNEMLARLESAVGRINRFTADASHELRSPVSFIRTVSECALRNPDLDAESKESFEQILLEVEDAARLLEDMLTLARADAGYLDARFERINLKELVEDVFEKARPLAGEKSQTMILNARANRSIPINGDRSSLRRLLWTLLDNAMKYTPAHGRIEVGLELAASEARVTIRDSGIGIPGAVIPRIFERFFRVDPSRGEVPGAGLGLAIAQWIADIHHATLSVQSVEGEGAVFAVAFQLTPE